MKKKILTLLLAACLVLALLPASALAAGAEELLFDNYNIYGVSSGAPYTAYITLDEACYITRILTYHWNGGSGEPGGTISLYNSADEKIGAWTAVTSAGQGGAPNVNWEAAADVTVPAGTYYVDCSGSAWSYNADSDDCGFVQVYGIRQSSGGAASTGSAGTASGSIPADAVTYGGHSYAFYSENLTWQEAEDFCEGLGGHLVTITAQGEQDFIEASFPDTKGWIGGYLTSAGDYAWITGEVMAFTSWNSGEPNNTNGVEDRICLYTAMQWNDTTGDNSRNDASGFYCEWDSLSVGGATGAGTGTGADAAAPATPTTTAGSVSIDPAGSFDTANVSAYTGFTTAAGCLFFWPQTAGALGVRVYRSNVSGQEGVSISDFYFTGNCCIDVNVDPSTTYYYTIRAVLKEAAFDSTTMTLTEEVLGPASPQIAITTPSTITGGGVSAAGQKYSILMTLDDPNMIVNGETQEIDPGRGTTPVLLNNRTLVPIRAIVEALGGNVGYVDATRMVTLQRGSTDISMWIDQDALTVSGVQSTMDVAPTIVNGRTMVPIRFAVENLGCQVEWINSTRQIIIVFQS